MYLFRIEQDALALAHVFDDGWRQERIKKLVLSSLQLQDLLLNRCVFISDVRMYSSSKVLAKQ